MKVLTLLTVSTMSLNPIESNCHALNDVAENAKIIGTSNITIEDINNKFIGDIYYLYIYLEEVKNEQIPLQLITAPLSVNTVSTITFSTENATVTTYETNRSLNAALDTSCSGNVNFFKLINLQADISAKVEAEYKDSLSVTTTKIAKQQITQYIDGVNNKFGIYAFVHCAATAYKFYVKYTHNRFYNYNQQEMYKTWMLTEDADCHIYLPIKPSRNINAIYHFNTMQEYNEFCDKRNL